MRVKASLLFKIFTAALLIISFVSLLVAMLSFLVDRRVIQAQAAGDALEVRDRLAASVTDAVWTFSYSQLDTLLAVNMLDQRLAYILVWDSEGSLMAGYLREADTGLRPLARGSEPVRPLRVDKVLYSALTRNGAPIGMLELGMRLEPLIQELSRDLTRAWFRSLLVALLGLLILVYYVKIILVDPIAGLNKAISRIGQRNFQARLGPVLDRSDEVGSLARNLQQMAEMLAVYASDLERQVAERTGRLIQSEKMAFLGSLTAGVAHEINTPVGVGVTAATHLQESLRRLHESFSDSNLTRSSLESFLAEAAETTDILILNLRRASHIVSSFKQIAADQSTEDLRQVQLASYIREILFSLRPRIKKTPHSLSVEVDEAVIWYGYPGLLSQLLSNLIINSLNYAYPDGRAGTISIQARVLDGDIVLEYGDDGCGLADEHLSKIFQPFFTTGREKGGTGLGLYIVQNIVSRLGGDLSCRSAAGEGLYFQITLPQQRNEGPEVA